MGDNFSGIIFNWILDDDNWAYINRICRLLVTNNFRGKYNNYRFNKKMAKHVQEQSAQFYEFLVLNDYISYDFLLSELKQYGIPYAEYLNKNNLLVNILEDSSIVNSPYLYMVKNFSDSLFSYCLNFISDKNRMLDYCVSNFENSKKKIDITISAGANEIKFSDWNNRGVDQNIVEYLGKRGIKMYKEFKNKEKLDALPKYSGKLGIFGIGEQDAQLLGEYWLREELVWNPTNNSSKIY